MKEKNFSTFINASFFIFFAHILLNEQCHEIFDFSFSTWLNFPQASDYTIRAILNFFENSQRYLKLKVHHRCCRHQWQTEKIFNQKSFHYFCWTPLGSRVIIQINFSFKFILSCQQFDIVPNDTGGKFATGVVDTGGAP